MHYGRTSQAKLLGKQPLETSPAVRRARLRCAETPTLVFYSWPRSVLRTLDSSQICLALAAPIAGLLFVWSVFSVLITLQQAGSSCRPLFLFLLKEGCAALIVVRGTLEEHRLYLLSLQVRSFVSSVISLFPLLIVTIRVDGGNVLFSCISIIYFFFST